MLMSLFLLSYIFYQKSYKHELLITLLIVRCNL